MCAWKICEMWMRFWRIGPHDAVSFARACWAGRFPVPGRNLVRGNHRLMPMNAEEDRQSAGFAYNGRPKRPVFLWEGLFW